MRLEVAQLLALLLESVINGVFLTLFCILTFSLVHSSPFSRIHCQVLIPVACAMMGLSVAHLTLGLIRAAQAFTSDHSPVVYYSDFGHPLQIAKTALLIAQTMLGDAVMVWRCCMVYDASKCFLMLSLLPLGFNLASGVLAALTFKRHISLFAITSGWFAAYFSINLAINLLCAAAVVYRITRSSYKFQTCRKAIPIVSVILKSGALYAAGVLGVLINYAVQSTGVYLALDVVVPLVGVVFSLIVLQIHFHLAASHAPGAEATLPTLGTLPRWRHFLASTDPVVADLQLSPHEGVNQLSVGPVALAKAASHPQCIRTSHSASI